MRGACSLLVAIDALRRRPAISAVGGASLPAMESINPAGGRNGCHRRDGDRLDHGVCPGFVHLTGRRSMGTVRGFGSDRRGSTRQMSAVG
ncbi:hypothetical protein KCP77_09705 [Salmonella enterica subsp. enterica]|nr:hypothetical protein KCP77_09705 [Salmonella enterica subsp. enterica]